MSCPPARGDFPEYQPKKDNALRLSETNRALALAHLGVAIDYGKTAINDLDRGWGGAARADVIEILIQLRELRNLLSLDPALEEPIGDELLREWMR